MVASQALSGCRWRNAGIVSCQAADGAMLGLSLARRSQAADDSVLGSPSELLSTNTRTQHFQNQVNSKLQQLKTSSGQARRLLQGEDPSMRWAEHNDILQVCSKDHLFKAIYHLLYQSRTHLPRMDSKTYDRAKVCGKNFWRHWLGVQ